MLAASRIPPTADNGNSWRPWVVRP